MTLLNHLAYRNKLSPINSQLDLHFKHYLRPENQPSVDKGAWSTPLYPNPSPDQTRPEAGKRRSNTTTSLACILALIVATNCFLCQHQQDIIR
ncbi:hypothetical protein Pcinc_040600 [Petrolisthes cinctipes]|uniref:Uncharacterized protein n=1 Tax=Petrolisthes cinctipes TaxID=88211 RepID=A0AAE1BLN3_PETCI|nr:hypothetical protein Pcinc_040600 [Petrolisthes cinctipes]